MPQLLRLYMFSVLTGFLLSIAFTALLLMLDIAHLRHLVMASSGGFVAVIMLVVFHTILFSGVQFGYRVMRLARNDEQGPRGRRQKPGNRAIPAPLAAAAALGKAPHRR